MTLPGTPFAHGMILGAVIGAITAFALLVIWYDLYCRRREREAEQFDVRAERVRLLREECRRPDPDNKKTVAVHFEDGDA